VAEQEWQCTEDMGSRRGARSNFFLKFHQLVSCASQRQSYRGVYQKARMCGRSSEHRLMVVLRPLTNPSFSQSASDQIILTCSRGCAVLSSLLERKRFGAKKKGTRNPPCHGHARALECMADLEKQVSLH